SAAADALRERKNPVIVLIGDGAYPEDALGSVVWTRPGAAAEAPAAAPGPGAPAAAGAGTGPTPGATIDLSGIDVRYIPVGQDGENVGIVAFNARRYLTDKTSYSVLVEVQNFGSEPAERKLVVYSGESAVDIRTLALQPG